MGPPEGEDCLVLSDGEETEDPSENSVLLAECSEDFPLKEEDMGEVVDEECEVIVTFCKQAKLMPHARYDCTRNPFEHAECETSHPLGRNAETCRECYCYVCNKHAAECKDWVTPSLCHCNAHNKSKYWKDQWTFVLTGGLVMFNLDLTEIDGDVQRGGRDRVEDDLDVNFINGENFGAGAMEEGTVSRTGTKTAQATSAKKKTKSKFLNRKANGLAPLRNKEAREKATRNVDRLKERSKLIRDFLKKAEIFSSYLQHMWEEGLRNCRIDRVLLQKFTRDISVEYNKYLSGEKVSSDCHKCLCHRNLGPGECDTCGLLSLYVTYRYSSVAELVTEFLNQAEQEKPKAETVLLLGASREILSHKHPAPYSPNADVSATLTRPVTSLMDRITRRLQRLLILNDFPKPLYNKFIHFYRSIPFPTHYCDFINSLDFVPWDHGLLTSVLKGKNTSGQRRQRRKKESLFEMVPVVEARIERMEIQQRYKELVRYLKVVECSDIPWLQHRRDKLPFYLCKSGDVQEAARALFFFFPESCCAACRLTPSQFEVFMKIFRTGNVPAGRKVEDCNPWVLVGAPLKLRALIKLTFQVVYSNSSLYTNTQCWSSVIRTFSSNWFLEEDGCLIPLTLKEPPPDFQMMVFRESSCIVEELVIRVHNNVFFSEVFAHMEAGLIFVVQALQQMLLREHQSLTSFLEIVLAFGRNIWALKLLLDSLARHKKALRTVVGLTIADLRSQKAEMLALWHRFGPWYVCELLCLFLSSRDRNVHSVAIIIVNILRENLQKCSWAKQVGEYLQNSRRHFSWMPPDVSSFIAASLTLP